MSLQSVLAAGREADPARNVIHDRRSYSFLVFFVCAKGSDVTDCPNIVACAFFFRRQNQHGMKGVASLSIFDADRRIAQNRKRTERSFGKRSDMRDYRTAARFKRSAAVTPSAAYR